MVLHTDIAVVGAGPAGCAAAEAARKFGAKVLLLEQNGSVGGMCGAGMLSNLCGDAESGAYRRFFDALGARSFPPRKVYAPERAKEIYLDRVLSSGADLLLHSRLFDVKTENGAVSSLLFAVKEGVLEVRARAFIDATGDGDLAFFAGVPFDAGRETDGKTQPMTLEFLIGGLDSERARFLEIGKSPAIKEKLRAWREAGRMPRPVDRVLVTQGPEKTTAYVNATNVTGLNGCSVFDLTKAEIAARAQIPALIAFLRENAPGYENAVLLASAPFTGVRESRRFRGAYTLTETDLAEGKVFPDRVTDGVTFSFDLHDPDGNAARADAPRYTGAYYTVPYRSLVPQGVRGMLLSGRCISGTHTALSSYRVIPIAMAIGEGAGFCAAVAVKNGCDVASLSPSGIAEVQALLEESKNA